MADSVYHSYKDREKEKCSDIKTLRKSVLLGEYNDSIIYFNRSYLWKSVLLNSFKAEFEQDELHQLPHENPGTDNDNWVGHSKVELSREGVDQDPLDNHHDKPETNGFKDETDILAVIKMDVERLIIDPIFQQEEIKNDIIQILYNYDKFTPYKQGFHEICGLIYLQLYRDKSLIFSSKDIQLETFSIFTALMNSLTPNFYNEDNLVGWCISTFNKYLLLIDPNLYDLMIKHYKIESQIWLIRWVRLIFLRELGLNNTYKVLDHLICFDYDITKLIPFIIIIFLIKIKMSLVTCEDQGEILYLLLHYPYQEYTNDEITEIVRFSIQLYNSSELNMKIIGTNINKNYHKGLNWDKIKNLDKLRLELKLQRRVRGALRK
ncbi:hypothetical protein WICMUC_005929 [Wickerhamomyces mucosus]|uniref:Rab-GAP TBC domain-containing protein n=1 Tax=Wickerhamomyces mucosus TaxID=1378264 RepID=A0A9P8P1N3_9ASCO|nr:hypothetical protein WICMUC_005929 [Wickerhamomyces mucosus]